MGELGIDVAAQAPQRLTTELAARADAVITMGCGDACPHVPGKKQLREDWDLPDPKERPLDEVRATRDDIDRRVRALVAELDAARERSAAPAAARRVPRLRLPRRPRDRVGHRRPAALPGRHGPAAALQLGRHRGGAVRDHPHVRRGLRRALQPGRLARRRRLRRTLAPRRRRLHPGPGRRLHHRRGRGERDVRAERDQHLRPSPRQPRAPLRRGDRDTRPAARDLRARAQRTGATAPAAVGAYIGAAYWFTSSTSFANPAITVGRMFSDTFAGIAPASVPSFVVAQLVGGAAAYGLIRVLYPRLTPAEAAEVVVPHGDVPARSAR